jgi:hypothetical protein
MKKRLSIAVSIILLFSAQCASSQAPQDEPKPVPVAGLKGVLVEARGEVAIVDPVGKTISPAIGDELDSGTIINVGKGGRASIMLMNGTIVDVPAKTTYIVGVMPKGPEKTTMMKGITIALSEAANVKIPATIDDVIAPKAPSEPSPRVRGMVKMGSVGPSAPRRPPPPAEIKKKYPKKPQVKKPDRKLSESEKQELAGEIAKADEAASSPDGKAFLKGQVYYSYGQYDEMVKTLKPVYAKTHSPAIKKLLKLGYVKMGLYDEARRYK